MNEPTENDRDRLTEILKQHVSKLCEHFENVQIFASNLEQGGDYTCSFKSGAGNWHARLAQAREWVLSSDEQVKEKARKDFEEDNE